MSVLADRASGAGVLDRLQVLRSAPTPLRGAPAATWPPSPRTGVRQLRVAGPGLQPWLQDTTTTRTDPAGSTLATPVLGPRNGVHLHPLLRATTPAIMDLAEGDRVETPDLAQALEVAFGNQYSELSRNKIARNAASSWTQTGHLAGRARKTRQRIKSTAVAATMAFFLGNIAGYHGAAVFSNPWCRLLDLNLERAKTMGFDAHRAGLLNLRAIGEVVELSFPLFTGLQEPLP